MRLPTPIYRWPGLAADGTLSQDLNHNSASSLAATSSLTPRHYGLCPVCICLGWKGGVTWSWGPMKPRFFPLQAFWVAVLFRKPQLAWGRKEQADPPRQQLERAWDERHSVRSHRPCTDLPLSARSGPNSAILLNILSYGRSRSRQEETGAGGLAPSLRDLLRTGPGGGFLVRRRTEVGSGFRSPRKTSPTRRGRRSGHSALLSVRSDLNWAAAAVCAGATSSLTLRTRRSIRWCRGYLGCQGQRKPGISSQRVDGPDHLASQWQRNWLFEGWYISSTT